ncbi:MAG TPA: sigma 54-interacting transcriptional regulator [Pirellulaceae bacterium]|nr:sigma 54-interacting transcriptional regulator [Pirellulaceae bacterium]
MQSYLIIREGANWSDVYRLEPGRSVTIGRSPTNEIVVRNRQCSRRHAEIFQAEGRWTVRDLDSRNGTLVAGSRIVQDWKLAPGDVIRVAQSQLEFVQDLAIAFRESPVAPPIAGAHDETAITATAAELARASADSAVADLGPALIMDRRGSSRLLHQDGLDEEGEFSVATPKVGEAGMLLCRLAFKMAERTDPNALSRLALEALFRGVPAGAGAVLLAPREKRERIRPEDLELIGSRSADGKSYRPLSRFLAETILRDGEAVMARNVAGDSAFGSPDSQGEFAATSVICAPLRVAKRPVGLLHLYCNDDERTLESDDLEFVLAVAEIMSLGLDSIERQAALQADLSHTRSQVEQLRQRLGVESKIVGSGPEMHAVHEQIGRAAPSKATILIRGESGVGKELVAQAVHDSSPRKGGPFVCLNCAALSETLLESELFGHEKGSFTGATDRKIGKFEQADKGTILLDEIGEMSPVVQAKFLRVLEGHPFERLGGARPIKVDVRVIAATNRDLEEAIRDKTFRKDLYFRLRVVEILVPPLRDRGEDVIEIAEHFLDRFKQETGRKIRGFTPDAIERIRRYEWPGNVRELKNVVERAVLLAQDDRIDEVDLALSPLSFADDVSVEASGVWRPCTLDAMEREHIQRTLDRFDWNKSRTSKVLGIERSTLDRKIRRLNIERKEA